MLSDLLIRLRSLFRRNEVESELDDELRFHFDQQVEKFVQSGLPVAEARRRARLIFGGSDQIKEECREARGIHFLETLAQDLHFGIHMLRKTPGFATIAVLTLALGIGANSAIFSVVDGILLRPLPYADVSRLVTIAGIKRFPGTDVMMWVTFDPSFWKRIQSETPAIERMAMYQSAQFTLSGQAAPEIVMASRVSNDFFSVLGTRPLLGRPILAADVQAGQERVAVLSYAMWRDMLGSDPRVVGREITLNERSYTVIGVMPPEFDFALDATPNHRGLWVPLVVTPADETNDRVAVSVIARLRKDVTREAADAQLKTVATRLSPEFPPIARGCVLQVQDIMNHLGDLQTPLLILQGAVGFVLLIACVNVSALLVGRGWARQREIAIRQVLGATRMRIVRQLLAESILLALLGGVAAAVLSVGSVRVMRVIAPPSTPQIGQVHLDANVLCFTFAMSIAAGILFSLVPALQVPASHVGAALKEGFSGILRGFSARPQRLRGALVVLETALALILVIGATLAARSFANLTRVNLGFRTDHVLTLSANFSPSVCNAASKDDLGRCKLAVAEIVRRFSATPGVESAAAVNFIPLQPGSAAIDLQLDGRNAGAGLMSGELTGIREISPAYFHALGLNLLGGREFTDGDTGNSPRVAIVNATFARRFLSGNALGHRLATKKDKNGQPDWIEIVGVVSDSNDYQQGQKPIPEYYLPLAQSSYFLGANFIVHTASNPLAMAAAVEQQVWSLDKNASITDLKTMDQVVAESVAEPRFRVLLLGSFGVLGLLLAVVGIYGVISFAVSRRTREISLRLALGAQPRDALRLILGQGMLLAGLGVAAGVAGALALTRFLESLLYEITPTDPTTFIGVAILVLLVAMAACYIPARRTMRVDPMVALKYE
jgi:putative ABC transport system permease protein